MDQALDEDKVVVLQTASAIDQLMKERDYLKNAGISSMMHSVRRWKTLRRQQPMT